MIFTNLVLLSRLAGYTYATCRIAGKAGYMTAEAFARKNIRYNMSEWRNDNPWRRE
jgi:hypothetical protein